MYWTNNTRRTLCIYMNNVCYILYCAPTANNGKIDQAQ